MSTKREVLKSKLNKIRGIIIDTMAMIRYPAGIITWSKQQIEDTDVKTQKLLRACGGFYPMSCIQRLYAKRKEGG